MEMISYQSKQISDLVDLLLGLKENDLVKIHLLSEKIHKLFNNGGKIAIVGNGGSAAEASHIATEFLSKCLIDHVPLPVICLNDSSTFITASANDYGFENSFSRLVEAYLKPNDILICLSTSGRSKNILNCINQAKKNNCYTILWTGKQKADIECDEIWHVDSIVTSRIQEIHLIFGHLLAEVVEKKFALMPHL